MTRLSLGDTRWAACANGHLNCTVAVGFIVFDLRDSIRQRLDDRHGDSHTGVGEYSGHAALAANQTNGHFQSSYRETLGIGSLILAFVAISRRSRQRTPVTRR